MKKHIYRFIVFCLLNTMTVPSFAWEHSLEVGYGITHAPNNSDTKNSGTFINSDFYHLYRTQDTYLTANASVGQWYSSASQNKNLRTAALSLALRYYLDFQTGYPFYLLGTLGPAYLTDQAFGNAREGNNFAAQWSAGIGTEFTSLDINLRTLDFMRRPSLGFSAVYILSVGFLF